VTLGPALYTAVSAADELAKYGLSAEIVDLRAAAPLNYGPLVESVRKTGKVLLLSDAVERGSVMHTVASNLTQLCFDDLDAPPVVIGSRNWITPAAELETLFFPQVSWVLDSVHARILPLKGYRPQTDQSLAEMVRRAKAGV
jgi:2-oxoisovalerate dehydrogenase E1 component